MAECLLFVVVSIVLNWQVANEAEFLLALPTLNQVVCSLLLVNLVAVGATSAEAEV